MTPKYLKTVALSTLMTIAAGKAVAQDHTPESTTINDPKVFKTAQTIVESKKDDGKTFRLDLNGGVGLEGGYAETKQDHGKFNDSYSTSAGNSNIGIRAISTRPESQIKAIVIGDFTAGNMGITNFKDGKYMGVNEQGRGDLRMADVSFEQQNMIKKNDYFGIGVGNAPLISDPQFLMNTMPIGVNDAMRSSNTPHVRAYYGFRSDDIDSWGDRGMHDLQFFIAASPFNSYGKTIGDWAHQNNKQNPNMKIGLNFGGKYELGQSTEFSFNGGLYGGVYFLDRDCDYKQKHLVGGFAVNAGIDARKVNAGFHAIGATNGGETLKMIGNFDYKINDKHSIGVFGGMTMDEYTNTIRENSQLSKVEISNFVNFVGVKYSFVGGMDVYVTYYNTDNFTFPENYRSANNSTLFTGNTINVGLRANIGALMNWVVREINADRR